MTQIVNLRNSDDPRDAIHRACQRLAEGDLVAFPTETVYLIAANPLSTSGVAKLVQLQPKSRRTLLLKSCFELADFADQVPTYGDKLARRAWPGPLTVALHREVVGGLFRDFPESTRRAMIAADDTVSFRVSAHDFLLEVLKLCPAPLMAASERRELGLMPRSAEEVAAQFGDSVALILDDGPCRYGEPSTIVRVDSKHWEIAESGVVSECTLQRLCSEVYLFVCTGNTCRSPMAEALFRRLLAEHLHCHDEELIDRGFIVLSAGLSAGSGSPASREAVSLLSEKGIDLRSHESQQLTERLLLQADHILTMTRGHRQSILNDYPDIANRVSVLASDYADIIDPYGGGPREYAACQESIEHHLNSMIMHLIPKS